MNNLQKILFFICSIGTTLLIMIWVVNAKVYLWLNILLYLMLAINTIPFIHGIIYNGVRKLNT